MEEPVPDIPRNIKPINQVEIKQANLLQSSENKANINNRAYQEAKSLKANDLNANYPSEDFSAKNKKDCVEFLKKYNYLIVNDEFGIEQDSLQGKII